MKRNVIIVISVLLIIVMSLLLVRNERLDRFNPFIKEKVAYAKVPKDTQKYKNITVYTEDGKEKSYKLDFLGYDPTKEYVTINHKGKYVRSIEYITKDVPSFLK